MAIKPDIAPAIDPAFDLEPVSHVLFRYAIISQQRTGSNWLCSLLTNMEYFGVPTEYLNERYAPHIAQRLIGPSPVRSGTVRLKQYIESIERVRTSSKGIFGIKIQPNQLAGIFADKQDAIVRFLSSFDRLVFLTRRDKLSQAVSGAICQATEKWWGDGTEPDLIGTDALKLMFDISAKLTRYIQEDNQMSSIGRSIRRPVLCLTYEDLLAAPESTLEQLVRFLGWEADPDNLPKHNILPLPMRAEGRTAQAVLGMFLDFIQGRKVELGPLPTSLPQVHHKGKEISA